MFVKELEITLENGMKISGELDLPERQGQWKTIILFHGSGPSDRHATVESMGGIVSRNFDLLSEGFVKARYAVFRYDKRENYDIEIIIRDAREVTRFVSGLSEVEGMLNIDSYTAAPVSLFSIVNKAHCQKKDLVNALMGQKNSNQKAFIWVRQNKGNDSRCIYFEGKNPSVLTGEILAITANAIFEMPRKDGIYTMASYLEKYQVLDELKKIDKFKSEGKI